MQAGRVEHLLVIGVIVGTEASDDVPMVIIGKIVFHKGSRDLFDTLESAVIQMFIIFVVGITGAYGISVVVIHEVGVKQQIAIVRELVGIVVGEAVVGIHLVVSHLMLHSEACVFTVKMVAAFGKGLIALGIDADAIQIVAFVKAMLGIEVHLSAKSGFFQSLDA